MRLPVLKLLSSTLLAIGLLAAGSSAAAPGAKQSSPELTYLKQINAWRPPADMQVMFVLMGQFANSGQYEEGIAYFNELLTRFGPTLDDTQRAQYLIAIAALRAGHANDVSLLSRYGWVKDTLSQLDEAKRLTGGQMFIARWMSGVVRTQLPTIFGERETAQADLQWCIDHVDKAPHVGWLREVYFSLSKLQRDQGHADEAARYLTLSGYTTETKPVVFTTPFSESAADGHQFSPPAIRELVPGSVYLLSGFGFTEFYFIVSADHKQLISIDAGSRSDDVQHALDALRARVPGLPPVTTVFVTHAHWDHVGGQQYFRGLSPAVRFVGRGSYSAELANDVGGDASVPKLFFGNKFRIEDVLAYKPDATIDRTTEMVIGGTRFLLSPTQGGETGDAMLIQMPDSNVLFAGDVFMPYFGAPNIAEGSVDGMLKSIDQIVAMHPTLILSGHEPLTRLFASTRMLADLKDRLAWLRSQVLRQIAAGTERTAVHDENLVPPDFATSGTDVHFAYLLLRENLIDRLFVQNGGYWQNGWKGMDHVSDADRGAVLDDYLGVNESTVDAAARKLIADGRHEVAADLIRSWQARHPADRGLDEVHRLVYLKLMEKYQDFNPFKYIVYSSQIGQLTPQMAKP
jgi:glyoxylase-like metal-dependent hydrolase (beta-lactamase superfamily II)